MTKKEASRLVIFLVICLLVFVYLNKVFTIDDPTGSTAIFKSFYDEEEDQVDGVYIGSSAAYRYWNGPRVFGEYGIAIPTLASAGLPIALVPDLIEEIKKTQDPKLYIIELRGALKTADGLGEAGIRRVTDNMNFSLNRIRTIQRGIEFAAEGDNEVNKGRMAHYFPIVKYHDRWDEGNLKTEDLLLNKEASPTKGFSGRTIAFRQQPQKEPVYTTKTTALDPPVEEAVMELLDYADGLDAEVLFVLSPYSETNENAMGKLNRVQEIAEGRGYPVLNYNTKKMAEKIGLNWKKDFYDKRHTNVIGADKYTDDVAAYIAEHYDLEGGHQGEAGYESWDEAYRYYLNEMKENGRLPDGKSSR